MNYGPLDLLIIQPSPFCNIDCSYCYLPERSNTNKIKAETVEKLMQRVIEADLIDQRITIVWHAGEPLAVPLSYYQTYFDIINANTPGHVKIKHSIQSNGMLVTEEWCRFIKENEISIGLSIDGREFLHDKNRVTRSGKGTHAKALEGAALLQKHNIQFHVIAVITAESCKYPDEIFNFFNGLGIHYLGLNFEEVEGGNTTSSFDHGRSEDVSSFLNRLYELQEQNDHQMVIREFLNSKQGIIGDPFAEHYKVTDGMRFNHQTTPYAIISVDYEGNFSSFSPELLGQKSERYGDFALGNVYNSSLKDALDTAKFRLINDDIQNGIAACKSTCEYFYVCGGGAPSNKYYENGSFNSTETQFCKLSIKAPTDIVLAQLEKEVGIRS